MRSARSGLLVLGLAILTLVGCAAPDDAKRDSAAPATTTPSSSAKKILTVPEAIKAGDQPMKVRGYVLIGPDGVARLCAGLAGSYPPQCGSPSLVVKGLQPDKLDGRESAQGIVWTGETTLRGTLENGVLTLS